MNKILQRVILLVVCLGLAAMAAAATVPNVLSQLPYAYGMGNFPAYQINQNNAYLLGYTDAAVATVTPAAWRVVAVSGVAASGGNYAVNTSSVAVTITLPASAANATVTLVDYAGTFGTHNLTVNAPSGVNLNGTSGSPASMTVSTNWAKWICVYLDSTIGYRCYN